LLSFLFEAISWHQKPDRDIIRTWAFIFSIFITTIFSAIIKDNVTYTYNQDCNPIFGIPSGPTAPFFGQIFCTVALDATLLILFGIGWVALHTFLLTLIK
jgi:hypothetical protein